MRLLALAVPLAFSALLLGCADPRVADPAEPLREARSAIFNGVPDPGHQAVVYVDLGGGSCTGTIIAACEGTGYVLTAAHCCDGPVSQAIMADDAWDPGAQAFDAFDTYQHPGYWGASDEDFCLFKISGAGPNTPVIPAMRPEEDNLKVGDVVEFVGYGITEDDYNNTQRRHVSDDISELTGGMMVYDQQPGGPCNGDSGGPALSKVNGAERVSGVTSQGDYWCTEYGESGRVSSVYDSFIAPYLGSCQPVPGGATSSSSSSSTSSSSTGAGPTTTTGAGGHAPGGGGLGGGGFGGMGGGMGGAENGNSDPADAPVILDWGDGGCAVGGAMSGRSGPGGAGALLAAIAVGLSSLRLRRRR